MCSEPVLHPDRAETPQPMFVVEHGVHRLAHIFSRLGISDEQFPRQTFDAGSITSAMF